jgi:2-keto-4-pentenoate hydratase/2-oxohepta-3-ene-1,7-dioic acid hydratase in catechol pathway
MTADPWRLGSAERSDRGPFSVLEVSGSLYGLEPVLGSEISVLEVLQEWDEWRPRISELVSAGLDAEPLEWESISWLPPILFPGKLIGVGANYRDHLEEMDAIFDPGFPRAFLKPATTGLVGSGRTVGLPANAHMVDWEAELAVVIGRRAKHVSGAEAMAAVAGYAAFNDLSARDWVEDQVPFLGMDLVRQKGFDEFGPFGPLITPAEFVGDIQAIDLSLTVNEVEKQAANTRDMTFTVEAILDHFLSFMTLEPGDVIITGSPAGVGYGRKPQEFIAPGDEVAVRIERLGPPLITRFAAP